MKLISLTLLVCAALAGSACGGSEEASQGASPEAIAAVTVSEGVKPKIEVDQVDPPETLLVEDLRTGKGRRAEPGDDLTVRFASVTWDGTPYQSSWDSGEYESFTFTLQNAPPQVIPGWDKGLPGMKAGGRRELIVPPEFVYQPNQFPDRSLRPDETYVYVVDLLRIR